jgi:hypothetical protein
MVRPPTTHLPLHLNYVNKIITQQDFRVFSVVIQMLYYHYGANNAITLNAYEVIPQIMCNLSIS